VHVPARMDTPHRPRLHERLSHSVLIVRAAKTSHHAPNKQRLGARRAASAHCTRGRAYGMAQHTPRLDTRSHSTATCHVSACLLLPANCGGKPQLLQIRLLASTQHRLLPKAAVVKLYTET
jgi:hypothetical protein